MGIILFLVDTSASMNQRTFLGTSYLDVAKAAIDTFMKVRYVRGTYQFLGGSGGFTGLFGPAAQITVAIIPSCSTGRETQQVEGTGTCWYPSTSHRMQ